MKPLILISAAALMFPAASLQALETAQARLNCLSLRFFQADGGDYGWDTLNLTTLSSGLNGELQWWGGSYSLRAV